MNEAYMSFPDQDVVLRTGATRRRNYRDLRFAGQMDDAGAALLEQRAGQALLASGQGFECERLGDMDEAHKGQLAENGLVNRLDLQQAERTLLYLDPIGGVYVLLCGQEHLLIRTLQEGENLERAVLCGRRQEELLGEQGEFAFDPQFGFLTSRAEDAGTGLCPWALLHLPLLAEEKLFPGLVREMREQGLTLAALEEGAGPLSRRFLLSSRSGFGLDEEEQVRVVREAAAQLTGCERELRENARAKLPPALFDRLCRAQAILRSARLMSAKEMIQRLSDLRLGVCLGLFEGSLTRIDQLDRTLRPCGLKIRCGQASEQALNAERADALRAYMASLS